MSFASLRQSRQARHVSLAQAQATKINDTSETPESGAEVAQQSSKWDIPSGLYRDLPDKLEIRAHPAYGRGLHVSNSSDRGTLVKSGESELSHPQSMSLTSCLYRLCNPQRRPSC